MCLTNALPRFLRGFAAQPLSRSDLERLLEIDLAAGTLDRAGDLDPRGNAELLEHLRQVHLDGLLADEQFRGDLAILAPGRHEFRDLGLALGQSPDAGAATLDRSGRRPMAEFAHRSGRTVPEMRCATHRQFLLGALQ